MKNKKKEKTISNILKVLVNKWYFLVLILVIIVPLCIHLLFKIPAINDFFIAIIPIGDLLTYEASIIGSLFLFLTVYITIKNSNNEKRIDLLNDKIIKLLELFSTNLSLKLYSNEYTDAQKGNFILSTAIEIYNNDFAIRLYLNKNQLLKYDEKIKPLLKLYNNTLSNLQTYFADIYYPNEEIMKQIQKAQEIQNSLQENLFNELKDLFDNVID